VATIAAVEDFRDAGEASDIDGDPQLFGNFPPGCFARRFTEVDLAARQAPRAGFRFGKALDEQ
jgi:hypothetical protein